MKRQLAHAACQLLPGPAAQAQPIMQPTSRGMRRSALSGQWPTDARDSAARKEDVFYQFLEGTRDKGQGEDSPRLLAG